MANGGVTIRWIKPPKTLQTAVAKYGLRVLVAIKAIADYIAVQAQNDMRQQAPWTDRTGNARNGLFSIAEQAASDTIIIYFSHGHSINYGIYLETMGAGKYAIIAPTMQRIYPELEKMLKRLFK